MSDTPHAQPGSPDPPDETAAATGLDQPTDDATRSPRLRLEGVIQALGVLVLIALPLGGLFWLLQSSTDNGELVTCLGTVTYKGQPVSSGYVQTGRQHANSQEVGALGILDKDGHFELTTNGEPGARLGRHRVAVMVFTRDQVPQPLVPRRYTDLKTTNLVIDIQIDTTKNSFELVLENDESTGSRSSAGAPQER